MTHDDGYMNMLQHVQQHDRDVLRLKNVKYDGAWIAEGGKSAWALTASRIHRLLKAMEPPTVRACGNPKATPKEGMEYLVRKIGPPRDDLREWGAQDFDEARAILIAALASEPDIFERVSLDPSSHTEGLEGLLDTIGDLRRYLLLIEAYLIWKKLVPAREVPIE